MFTSFLFEKLSHLNQFYKTETEFIEHLMSGEVKISIPDLIKFQQEYDNKKPPLPSQHQIDDDVWFSLWGSDVVSKIHAVHFYTGKVKYDLNVFGGDGQTTRIYNVDSVFVHKTIKKL